MASRRASRRLADAASTPALSRREAVARLRAQAHPLDGGAHDYDALMSLAGDARIVLLGAASYGTHEMHVERLRISKRLIEEHGFTAVAVEADRLEAQRVDRFVRGAQEDATAADALSGFRRFPDWMWRNAETEDLVSWLRRHNDGRHRSARKVSFFGLDRIGLGASAEPVTAHVDGRARAASWNERETYMADALDCLTFYLDRYGGTARVIVWTHNAHAADARGSQMAPRGLVSLGQLLRERHPGEVVSVGFTTYEGAVTAASRWGGPPESRSLPPAQDASCEALLHETGLTAFTVCPLAVEGAAGALGQPRPQTAIGGVRDAGSEDLIDGAPAAQYDALVHIDRTRACDPLPARPGISLSRPA